MVIYGIAPTMALERSGLSLESRTMSLHLQTQGILRVDVLSANQGKGKYMISFSFLLL